MFRLVKILNGRINESEPMKLKAAASANYSFGSALSVAASTATNCSATTKPLYICGEEAKANEKTEITVYPIDPYQIFETTVCESPLSLNVGNKVTLNVVDGAAVGVTATTTGGVAEIFDLNYATKAGDKVYVRIV